MKMKIKYFLIIVVISALFYACPDDDDGIESIPERDREEQQIIDNDSLIGYLETHYYNSGDFGMGNPNPDLSQIVVTELMEGETVPDDHTLLIDAVETHTTLFLDIEYDYYILRINQGGSAMAPNFSDNVRVNFAGSTLDDEIFDDSVNPVDFDMTSLIPAWSRVMPQFNAAESFVENGDGTVSYNNFGVGIMYVPSGLGFWSAGAPGVQPYSNLIFAFDMYQTEVLDHDDDNVPSYLEDIDGDLALSDDDTDGDGLADFIDVDDDGDLVLTKYEDLEPDEDLLVDRDGDGDPTNDIGDLDPTNDDRNGNDIPNYLDDTEECSNQDYTGTNGIPDCDL